MNAQATNLTVDSGAAIGHPIRIARGRDLHYLIAGLRRRARLIAVVADGAHFPLQPWVVDTVTFVVP